MVAIGGVGGSGTRLVAQMLNDLGYFIGDDLNGPNDNLLFTLLFKYEQVLTLLDSQFDYNLAIFMQVMNSSKELSSKQRVYLEKLVNNNRIIHDREWLQERYDNIRVGSKHDLWGWKEPNTHIVIERLFQRMDDLKFIYVYRNGLDMAYSDNQFQLQLWGGIFLNQKNIEISPKNSLKYWCEVHRRMVKLQEDYPNRVLMLDFDGLCHHPEQNLKKLLEFIAPPHEYDIEKLKSLIKVPSSIGRYKAFSLDNFDSDDLAYIDSIYKG